MTIVLIEANVDEVSASIASVLAGRIDGWTAVIDHDYLSVDDLWMSERYREHKGLSTYSIGQKVTTWFSHVLPVTAVMTRRDDLVAGDRYFSSHFGVAEVRSVTSRGLTATIRGTLQNQIEMYERASLVPKF
ncbi:hypothetical protein F1C58_16725 (plasmid) [Glaciihabitans sp. INWT7]|uniref:hypothetical protein n=1 Tax=Glaciihabitans sp. INWT7 TaxID=2596912 RepID=UPI001628CDB3|nr:hypothetical protein [Glaciihabitans sp. INWT7]QNE48702.1 hypothetical protein F1C58_16725 [Glaciihabitans sp. INWT7]